MSHARTYIALLLLLGASACADERVYLGEDKLYQVALTDDTAAAVEGEEGALFIVETRAEVPVIRPTQTEMRDLMRGRQGYPRLPFSRLPWVERGDIELSIDFVLTNLDSESREVAVIVNGANEFDEYVPGVVDVEDEPVPLHSQWERHFTLEPKSRVTYTVREEELDEAAVDLATVVNGAPNPDQVVYFENKSSTDERSRKYIPEVVPGLVALRLGLRATQAAPILLEATVRARDVGDKLAGEDDDLLRVNPEPFEASVPEP
jgi:hypothetical protein